MGSPGVSLVLNTIFGAELNLAEGGWERVLSTCVAPCQGRSQRRHPNLPCPC